MNESTRKAGSARGMRLRQEQKDGGGGDNGTGHDDKVTFVMQGGMPGDVEGENGGGGEQSDGEV